MAEGHFFQAQGNEIAAKQALKSAFEVCLNDEEGDIPSGMKEQIVTELEQSDQRRDAQQLVAGMQLEESQHNQQARDLYSDGKIAQALDEMKLAMEDKPRSFAVNLNFAQVALHFMVENQLDAELMEQVRGCFDRIQNLPRTDDRFELKMQLYQRYKKMEQSL
jgi:hypothetical protein